MMLSQNLETSEMARISGPCDGSFYHFIEIFFMKLFLMSFSSKDRSSVFPAASLVPLNAFEMIQQLNNDVHYTT